MISFQPEWSPENICDICSPSLAPCSPQGIREAINCDNGTLSFAWSAVPGAITYTATLEELGGGTPSCCTTSATGCDIGDLPCGEMYILHVTAEGRTCNSTESDGVITRTGMCYILWYLLEGFYFKSRKLHFNFKSPSLPVACVPENLKANLVCSSNVASMSWGYSRGGQLYMVRAVDAGGRVSECRSPDNRCDLTDLVCGAQYTTTVTAEDMQCKSKPSDSVTIKTGMTSKFLFWMHWNTFKGFHKVPPSRCVSVPPIILEMYPLLETSRFLSSLFG